MKIINNHKKLICVLLLLILPLVLTGNGICYNEFTSGHLGADISLCTDYIGVFDRSYNESSWNAMKKCSEATGMSINYYTPAVDNESNFISVLNNAATGNASIIIASSYKYCYPLWTEQYLHPDIKYILIDAVPTNQNGDIELADNTMSMCFREEQAGFLAGYSAVMDGYRNIGFAGGMAQPAVVRFGYGFLYGADYAAKELGLKPDDVICRYTYLGTFSASPDAMAQAVSWYSSGTEVIFVAAGSAASSVIKAAEQTGCKVIGVDSDMSGQSETVITSALKNIGAAVEATISDYESGSFKGGIHTFSAKDNGVGLPMETSRFRTFSQEQYDTILSKLSNEEIDMNVDIESIDDLPLEVVDVLY